MGCAGLCRPGPPGAVGSTGFHKATDVTPQFVPGRNGFAHWCTMLVSVAVRLLMHPRCRQATALLA